MINLFIKNIFLCIMLHICPKITKLLSYPKYIVYNNILKYNVQSLSNQFLDTITFESSNVKDIMTIEEINRLNNNLNRKILYDGLDTDFNYIYESINKVANDIVKQDILNHSYFIDTNTWDVTNLLRKYKVQSFEVFISLVSSNNITKEEKEKLYNIFNEHVKNDYDQKHAYFDYYEGISIKNCIPSDINDDNTPCKLNFRKYDLDGWERISKLLMFKLDSRTDSFKEVVNENENSTIINNIITQNNIYKTIIFDTILNKKFNDYAEKKNLSPTMKKYINNKTTNWNHRYNYKGKCEWDYQVKPYYEKYVKDYIIHICNAFELHTNESNENYYQVRKTHKFPIEYMSMVNMLMFGKTNVTYDFLERLLSYVRFENNHNSDTFQLDNYVLKKYLYASEGNKRYNVLWKDDNIGELKFAVTDYDKLYVAKNMIQLMNEVDPDVLNHHNYVVISEWYRINDYQIQTEHIDQENEIKRLQSKDELYKTIS